jgi:signal transduction histidine kinase/CheY-like chemotaxis protein
MTPQTKTTTSDLFHLFDLAVFEQLPDGFFQSLGTMPLWMPVLSWKKEGIADLSDRFPLLDSFLPSCEEVWETRSSDQVYSDVWTDTDRLDREIYLQAVAAASGGRRFVALRSLPCEAFAHQQSAHDLELAQDQIVRLSHELELKRREADRANQAKTDFLNTMSHEIRTPMNAIIGMADVLSLTPLNPEQQKYVEIFQRNGVSLLNLINDILDLSKVESGHVELEDTDFDLSDVITRAMEVVEPRVTAKGLWLRQSINSDVPRYLIGDPNRLRQVIINLLGNSIKFTEKGGLEVSVEPDPENREPGRLRFAITDTGIGIPEDKLGVIFESFTQADSSTTRKYGGTGLGLNISRQLVELMSGRIRVESTLGVGSTFFFTARFKMQDDQSVRTETKTAQPTHATGTELEALLTGFHILLVDDSEDNRTLILRYMGRCQCVIDIAENGLAGVELFKTGIYDAVLMDVEMPVMDGYQAVGEIRRIEGETGASPTPVMALTAHAFGDMIVKGRKAGFTDVLTKPIRRATLLESLARFGPPKSGITPPPPVPASRVPIQEGMEDVVPGYLEKRRADVALYRQHLKDGDFSSIAKLAHKMKGTGAGYGFPRLTDLGSALEKAANNSDAEAVKVNVEEFETYVKSVVLEFPA